MPTTRDTNFVFEGLPLPLAGWLDDKLVVNAAWKKDLPFLSFQLEKLKTPAQLESLLQRGDWGFQFLKIEGTQIWVASPSSYSEQMKIEAARGEVTSKLIAGVSHEINNPLAIIVGLAAMMTMQAPKGTLKTEDILTYGEKINLNVEKITKLVKSLRSFSNWDDLGVRNSCSLEDVIQEVLVFSEARFKNYSVHFETHINQKESIIAMPQNKAVFAIYGLLSWRFDQIKTHSDSTQKYIKLSVQSDNPEHAIIRLEDNGFEDAPAPGGRFTVGVIADLIKSFGGSLEWQIHAETWTCQITIPRAK